VPRECVTTPIQQGRTAAAASRFSESHIAHNIRAQTLGSTTHEAHSDSESTSGSGSRGATLLNRRSIVLDRVADSGGDLVAGGIGEALGSTTHEAHSDSESTSGSSGQDDDTFPRHDYSDRVYGMGFREAGSGSRGATLLNRRSIVLDRVADSGGDLVAGGTRRSARSIRSKGSCAGPS
jgi:hypothetical protein